MTYIIWKKNEFIPVSTLTNTISHSCLENVKKTSLDVSLIKLPKYVSCTNLSRNETKKIIIFRRKNVCMCGILYDEPTIDSAYKILYIWKAWTLNLSKYFFSVCYTYHIYVAKFTIDQLTARIEFFSYLLRGKKGHLKISP